MASAQRKDNKKRIPGLSSPWCARTKGSWYAFGRVEPGGYPPGAPTDPDLPNFRTAGTRHPVPPKKVSKFTGKSFCPSRLLSSRP
jgi:hypothetical protein